MDNPSKSFDVPTWNSVPGTTLKAEMPTPTWSPRTSSAATKRTSQSQIRHLERCTREASTPSGGSTAAAVWFPRRCVQMRARVLLASVVAVAAASSAPAADPIDVPARQRQLFLDDDLIASTSGLRKTLHQPEKKGAVVFPNQPWEVTLQTRCVPAWDDNKKIYKLWLITSTPLEGVAGTTYAESKDGIHWRKPTLRQYVYDGSLENNFINVGPVQLEWPDNAICNVVYDPDDPDPSRRYKGLLGASGRRPIVSADGIHWTRLDVPKLPSYDESNLSYSRLTKTFIATFKTEGPHGRSHAIWTSKDFETWTNTKVVFSADDEDQRRVTLNIEARRADPTLQQAFGASDNPAEYNADIYNMGIFRYEGAYVGMPAVLHTTGGADFHLIQLVSSRDLRTWLRLGDRQPFIGPSPVGGPGTGQGGLYDLALLLPPSAPVVHGDELWFYYTGVRYRGPETPETEPNGAVHLAVLRRDGFISVDAVDGPGTLRTKPFVVSGTKLLVNVDSEKGDLKVEVLDAGGKVLKASRAIVGDRPRAIVEWKSSDFAGLKGKTVSLRFTLRKASLYSFWLEN